MKFNVITLFPQMIEEALKHGVVGQALTDHKIALQTVNPRSFTHDRHHTVDDRPFGGGDGMVMLYEPLKQAMQSLAQSEDRSRGQSLTADCGPVSEAVVGSTSVSRRVLLSAHGQKWSDKKAREWATAGGVITLVCGRYGGVDQRFINEFIDEEISVGDYILSGGELAALTVIDSVTRLLPEVLGNVESINHESFAQDGLLEAPLFTRPQTITSQKNEEQSQEKSEALPIDKSVSAVVPRVFVSGDHKRIEKARRVMALLLTAQNRPDLLTQIHRDEILRSSTVLKEFSYEELAVCGLTDAFIKSVLTRPDGGQR